MIRTLAPLSAVALLGLAAMATMAAPASTNSAANEESSALSDLDARVAELRALPADQRRAQLKAMPPEERRTLWQRLRADHFAGRDVAPQTYVSNAGQAVTGNAPTRAVGSIQYDDGLPTIGFGGGAIVGNRFNTQSGNPLFASGTVSTVQAVVVPGPANTTSSAGFVLLGPQTGGGGAMAIFSTFTNAATGVIDTVSWTGIAAAYTGSSFFVLFGDFASVYIPVFGTGTNNGQGHHGVVGYTGGMGPNITSTFDFGGALNSVIRARGNILPVELISFDIE